MVRGDRGRGLHCGGEQQALLGVHQGSLLGPNAEGGQVKQLYSREEGTKPEGDQLYQLNQLYQFKMDLI